VAIETGFVRPHRFDAAAFGRAAQTSVPLPAATRMANAAQALFDAIRDLTLAEWDALAVASPELARRLHDVSNAMRP
jgi:hypothetical protein